MSAGDANPYYAPLPSEQYDLQTQSPHDHGFEALRPLVEATFWLKLQAWTLIVLGVLQCLTIVGILVAWLPIWMGWSLKNAAERIGQGQQTRNWQSVFDGCKDLKTYFVILGVLTLINFVVLALYLLMIFVFIILALVGAAANQ